MFCRRRLYGDMSYQQFSRLGIVRLSDSLSTHLVKLAFELLPFDFSIFFLVISLNFYIYTRM